MAWRVCYREQLYSSLPPTELLRRLQASLLPADAPTWRDDYKPAANLLFQGRVTGNTFHLLRFRHGPPRREAGPFPIQGHIHPHAAGSCVSLRYDVPREGWFLLYFQAALAGVLILCVTGAIWYSSRSLPWFSVLLLGILPLWLVSNAYFSLHQEAVLSRPLLVDLLQLWSPPAA